MMFKLTREVRFAINAQPDAQLAGGRPSNSFGGFPSLTGLGHFFTLQVTLAAELDPRSSYLLNIKDVDSVVRQRAVSLVEQLVRSNEFRGGGNVVLQLFDLLRTAWPIARLDALRLSLSPLLSLSVHASEHPMVRLSQKFEFSASHRLHSPQLSEEENRRTFGKCNNPHGHGHNYELQVTLVGRPDQRGVLIDVPVFERVVAETVIEPFDHKNLNEELPQFAEIIPSVENIAKVIYRMLVPKFAAEKAKLASVTVWETPKTWCEYSE
jgi:6-pyruvoyltetrahydropterin/6-carboxytetrahydropterin synthase